MNKEDKQIWDNWCKECFASAPNSLLVQYFRNEWYLARLHGYTKSFEEFQKEQEKRRLECSLLERDD